MLADDWTSLRDVQYRKIHLYDLDWSQDEDRQLDRCLVAVAKYGGAVAMVRDETKLIKVRGPWQGRRRLPAALCRLLGIPNSSAAEGAESLASVAQSLSLSLRTFSRLGYVPACSTDVGTEELTV